MSHTLSTLRADRSAILENCLTIEAHEDCLQVLRLFGELPGELAEKLYHCRVDACGMAKVDVTPDDAFILRDEAQSFEIWLKVVGA